MKRRTHGLAALLAFVVAGWKGVVIAAGAIALEQYGAESTKAIFARPRPSRELIAVVGNPNGFSFPLDHVKAAVFPPPPVIMKRLSLTFSICATWGPDAGPVLGVFGHRVEAPARDG